MWNLFGWETRGRRKRMVELAGMIKEANKGTMIELHQILARFATKAGLRIDTASGYLELLIEAGFIVITHGEETWVYNGEREQEIFGVSI